MPNKTRRRKQRQLKRERIRQGPSETAQAWLELLGISIHKYRPDGVPGLRDQDGHLNMQALTKYNEEFKAWIGQVNDTPHITRLLYCTCDEQWIKASKELRARADKFKREHPDQMVFPHGAVHPPLKMDFETIEARVAAWHTERGRFSKEFFK